MKEGHRRSLESCTIEGVAEAVDAFEENQGLMLCEIQPTLFSKVVPFFTVPEGYYALVQRGGRFADYRGSTTWPAGIHFGPPWMRVAYLVTKQSLVYQCNVKHCITRDNIPILVRATLMLRVMGDAEKGEDPALVRTFVHRVGVRGLEAQLVNAVAEAIRVMARATQHKAVYSLTSGGETARGLPRDPSARPPPPAVTTHTHAAEGETVEKRATGVGVHVERARRGSMKRVKVAPNPDWSNSESSIAAAPTAAADDTSTAARHVQQQQQQQQQPASPASTSPSLPAIRRGLRASRIAPLADAETTAGKQPGHQLPEEEHGAPPSAVCMDDRRRVYPSEVLLKHERQGTAGALGSDGDSAKGEGAKPRIPSRPPPVATNLDLSSSPTAVSSSSTLPPLELDVAPLPSLPPTPSSPTSGRAMLARERDGDQNAAQSDGDIESHPPVAWASGDPVDIKPKACGDGARGGAAAAAAAGEKEVADEFEGNETSLGRRHAEKLRDRLNRTFSPQGVEITAVIVRSTELPFLIAEQMSGRTLNASLAAEQRAVKKSESQRVRHEGEVRELLQRCGIERSLILREGEREIAKAKHKLHKLRAQSAATLEAIAAESESSVQRLASEAQLEVSQSRLKEEAGTSLRACASGRAAGIVAAEASAFRARRESGADLEVAQNNARARGLVDAAEGDGAPMLRAARVHFMDNKRVQVLGSLAKNDLALVVTSPLLSAASSARERAGSTAGLGPKKAVDALTALLLGEAGFKAQAVEDARPPPPPPPPLPRNGSSRLSRSSTPSSTAQRRRVELGAQLLLAIALGPDGGNGGSATSCSSFAVRLNSGPTPPAAEAINRTSKIRGAGGSSRGNGGSEIGDAKLAVVPKKSSVVASAQESENGIVALLPEERGGNESPRERPRAKEAAAASAAALAADACGGVSAAPACELCVLRDGVPHQLPCIV